MLIRLLTIKFLAVGLHSALKIIPYVIMKQHAWYLLVIYGHEASLSLINPPQPLAKIQTAHKANSSRPLLTLPPADIMQ